MNNAIRPWRQKNTRWNTLTGGVFFSIILTILIVPGPGLSQQHQGEVTDRDVTIAIESRFLIDHAVSADAIDVQTEDGIVTLTGRVSNLLAKQRAEKIAASTRGVQALVNAIQVTPDARVDDKSLEIRVLAALAADPAADAYELYVDAEDGRITLSGTVDSWQEKQLSEQVVMSVEGVQDMESRIQVKPAAARPDSELEAEVVRRLQSDVWVDEQLIGVMVRNGHVTLTGTVGSLTEKYSAFTDAWVSGVTSVDADRLQVEWGARDRMLADPGKLISTPARIQEDIRTAMQYDPRLQDADIGIEIHEGTAILTGTVPNMAAKQAATERAQRVPGIWEVRNKIRVQSLVRIPDEELEKRVVKAFTRHPLIHRYAIKVHADKGTVSLEGYLQSVSDIAEAVRVASRVKGVTDIVNYLQIESSGKSDETLWKEIRRAFWWDPRLYNQDITMTVSDGIVTLDGTVPSLVEWRLAKNIARESGAEEVRNNLHVREGAES